MGYKIVKKTVLSENVIRMEIQAPLVAKKALAGQFVILRAEEDGERIPLTISDYDREKGTVCVVFQTVGATTQTLGRKKEGETIPDFVGPLGTPTKIRAGKIVVVGGGVGCAIALPAAKAFRNAGAEVFSVIGFRNKAAVILEEEFRRASSAVFVTTDDGSCGEKGNVCLPLRRLLETEKIDEVLTIGPIAMMKYVALTTKEFGVKTIASMNPIMIDGTGMCGGCRLTVGGKTKFACVDGPEFDAHEIDFEEAASRLSAYAEFERKEREKTCNLFLKETDK